MRGERRFIQAVMVGALGVNLAYLAYRAAFTLNLDGVYASACSIALLAAELHCFASLALFYLQIWDPQYPEPPEAPPGLAVDVLVPTYNEDTALLRATLTGCVRMAYPHRTWILDDGRRESVRSLAAELGIEYVQRDNCSGAKAGNLNHALSLSTAELVVILDADHVPHRDLLVRTVGYFTDPRVAFVQTPHTFYNLDSFQYDLRPEKLVKWEEQEVFFHLIQPGRQRWNAVAFAGSAAIFRRTALDAIGHFPTETITEDLHTSLRLHARGWRAIYHSEPLSTGLAAKDLHEFQDQRLRWAEGNLSILTVDNPLTMSGLTLAQRLVYFGSIFHWTIGLPKLVFYCTPILMLFTDVHPVNNFDDTFLVLLVIHLTSVLTAVKIAGRGWVRIVLGDIFTTVGFWTYVRATFRALFRVRSRFRVTKKTGSSSASIVPRVTPHLVLVFGCLTALVWATLRLHFGISTHVEAVGAGLFWIGINLIFALASLRRAILRGESRNTYRFPAWVPASLTAGGATVNGLSADLSPLGLSLTTMEPPPAEDCTVTIALPNSTVVASGTVRWKIERRRCGVTTWRAGIQLDPLPSADVDLIDRFCFDAAIPRHFARFRPPLPILSDLARSWQRAFRTRRRSHRRLVRLPVTLVGPDRRRWPCVTDDVSTHGFAVIGGPSEAAVEFEILTPSGPVAGAARIARTGAALSLAGAALTSYEITAIDEAHLERLKRALDERRGTIPPELRVERVRPTPPPSPVLRIDRARLAVVAVTAALALCAEPFIYVRLNADCVQLAGLLRSASGRDDVARGHAIQKRVLASDPPDLRAAELLSMFWAGAGQREHSVEVMELILRHRPGDWGVRLRLADTLDAIDRFDAAALHYAWLMRGVGSRPPTGATAKLLIAAARNAVHRKKPAQGAPWLERVAALLPAGDPVHEELASLYTLAGQFGRAADAYLAVARARPRALDVRYRLVEVYCADGRFDRAEAMTRELARVPAERVRAERMMAEILIWKNDFTRAAKMFDALRRLSGGGGVDQAKLAHLELWRKEYDHALETFQSLLEQDATQTSLWPGWIDSAASARAVTDRHRAVALAIRGRLEALPPRQPRPLARLAWVLVRVNERRAGIEPLMRALSLSPDDADLRLQLADALHEVGEYDRAEEHYTWLLKRTRTAAP